MSRVNAGVCGYDSSPQTPKTPKQEGSTDSKAGVCGYDSSSIPTLYLSHTHVNAAAESVDITHRHVT